MFEARKRKLRLWMIFAKTWWAKSSLIFLVEKSNSETSLFTLQHHVIPLKYLTCLQQRTLPIRCLLTTTTSTLLALSTQMCNPLRRHHLPSLAELKRVMPLYQRYDQNDYNAGQDPRWTNEGHTLIKRMNLSTEDFAPVSPADWLPPGHWDSSPRSKEGQTTGYPKLRYLNEVLSAFIRPYACLKPLSQQ